eukprot:674312-Amphidinium_carterae.1
MVFAVQAMTMMAAQLAINEDLDYVWPSGWATTKGTACQASQRSSCHRRPKAKPVHPGWLWTLLAQGTPGGSPVGTHEEWVTA